LKTCADSRRRARVSFFHETRWRLIGEFAFFLCCLKNAAKLGYLAAFELAAQQNKDAGKYGKECQDYAQTGDARNKCHQASENKPDA
jgi:hypothetical protein